MPADLASWLCRPCSRGAEIVGLSVTGTLGFCKSGELGIIIGRALDLSSAISRTLRFFWTNGPVLR